MIDETIIAEFNKRYKPLIKSGMEVIEIKGIERDAVIFVSTPFMFDRREVPEKFMRMPVRQMISQNTLPQEFQNLDKEKEYVWAYQRFEQYVKANSGHIKEAMDNPDMTRKDMLDALCFGDFEKHKETCETLEENQKIPSWKN